MQTLEDGLKAAHCQLPSLQARAEAAEAQCGAAEAAVASALAGQMAMEAVRSQERILSDTALMR